MQKAAAPVPKLLLTETQAAEAMWAYYKANRLFIHSDCRQFRDVILAELMQGAAVEKVFDRFWLHPEPVGPVLPAQKARRARATA